MQNALTQTHLVSMVAVEAEDFDHALANAMYQTGMDSHELDCVTFAYGQGMYEFEYVGRA